MKLMNNQIQNKLNNSVQFCEWLGILTVKQKRNLPEEGAGRLSVHARLGLPVDVKKVKKSKRTVREASPDLPRKAPAHQRVAGISTKKLMPGMTI